MKHFSFSGMQRSGNHACISWLVSHFYNYRHRNNIQGLHYESRAAQTEWWPKETVYEEAIERGDVELECHIDSWENYSPFEIKTKNGSPLIIILRDPYNWFASWHKFAAVNSNIAGVSKEASINWYMKYVEYVRMFPDHFISYNHWFSSWEYRRILEMKYGLGFSDATLNKIPDIVHGSTFDHRAFNNNAQQMNVLNRWKQVADRPEFRNPLRKHPELQDVAREFFGMEPPKL